MWKEDGVEKTGFIFAGRVQLHCRCFVLLCDVTGAFGKYCRGLWCGNRHRLSDTGNKGNILLGRGIITSAVYIYVFGHNGFYANMGLQGYYLVISVYGWYYWRRQQESEQEGTLSDVRKISSATAAWCLLAAAILWAGLWLLLDRATDSPVPVWDGLITSLSVVATWMLTKKYLEQWYVWIGANAIAVVVYLVMGMYPTAVVVHGIFCSGG